MRFDVLTLFPRMFDSPFGESIIAKAATCGKGGVDVTTGTTL